MIYNLFLFIPQLLLGVMPHVEVHNVLQVGPLDADSEGVRGVECKGYEPSCLGRRVPTLYSSVDFEL